MLPAKYRKSLRVDHEVITRYKFRKLKRMKKERQKKSIEDILRKSYFEHSQENICSSLRTKRAIGFSEKVKIEVKNCNITILVYVTFTLYRIGSIQILTISVMKLLFVFVPVVSEY